MALWGGGRSLAGFTREARQPSGPSGQVPWRASLSARRPGQARAALRGSDMLCPVSIAAEKWLATFAERLGVEAPTQEEVEAVLRLASTAARASERAAAPVACWLAARAETTLSDALELALGLTELGSNPPE